MKLLLPLANLRLRFLFLALTLAALAGSSRAEAPAVVVPAPAAAPAAAPAWPESWQPNAGSELIARAVTSIIEQNHYSGLKLSEAMSRQLFDEYFDRLDPARQFFRQSDVDEFRAQSLILHELLRRGDLGFAFSVYKRFAQRVDESLHFAREQLHSPLDFTVEESLLVDRTEAPRPATEKEQQELWRLFLKNRVLLNVLAQEQAQKAKDKKDQAPPADPGKAAPPDETAKGAQPVAPEAGDTVLTGTPEERTLRYYEQIRRAVWEVERDDIVELYLDALCNVFDPHSGYMNARSQEDFDMDMKLSLQGIGAVLGPDDGYTKVVSIMSGGPAQSDGRLQPGDRIIAVGQGEAVPENVVDMPLNKVVRKIRGPKGSVVTLTVIKNLNGVPQVIRLVRDEVKLTEQEAKSSVKLLPREGGRTLRLGIIDLPSFYADFEGLTNGEQEARSSTRDVRRLVDRLSAGKEPVDGLLIDLRGNPGGSLEEAISIAGLFVPQGPVVQVRYPFQVKVREDEDGGFAYNMPLVVLVDHTTASACEIFSAAMQDYQRGIIVGDKATHGKGTVVTVLRLDRYTALRSARPGALKYAMAKFYRVNGGSTQLRGMTPDLVFPSYYDYLKVGESALKHALPWDEIKPAAYAPSPMAVARFIPQLQAHCSQRSAADPEFQQLIADIQHYGERQKTKTFSLRLDERRADLAEEDRWVERRKQFFKSPKTRNQEERAGVEQAPEPVAEVRDPMLRQSLLVLGDLIGLQTGAVLAGKQDNAPAAPLDGAAAR